MGSLANKRVLVLIAGAMTGGLGGAIYMWSIFNQPLMELRGWSLSDVSLAYSMYLLILCFAGFVCGWMQQRVKPHILVLVAGICFSAGWFLAGVVDSIPMLYLSFGLLGGGGAGFIYNTVISCVTLWYPDKRGFANGVCLGAIAISSLVFAPLGNFLIEAMDVTMAFRVCGIIFFVIYVVFSWFIRKPEPGWKPEGWNPDNAPAAVTTSGRDFTTPEMLKTPFFWVLWIMVACACTSGMMITGHTTGIGQSMAGMTAAQGALQVGIFAVANFLGRLASGSLSDRFGRFNVLAVVVIITAIDMALLFPHATNFPMFVVAICIVGACFGGILTMLPPITGDMFGSKHYGLNYAFVYSGYTLASFIGPQVAANMLAGTGSYIMGFYIAAAISVIGFVLVFVVKGMAKRLAAQSASQRGESEASVSLQPEAVTK